MIEQRPIMLCYVPWVLSYVRFVSVAYFYEQKANKAAFTIAVICDSGQTRSLSVWEAVSNLDTWRYLAVVLHAKSANFSVCRLFSAE